MKPLCASPETMLIDGPETPVVAPPEEPELALLEEPVPPLAPVVALLEELEPPVEPEFAPLDELALAVDPEELALLAAVLPDELLLSLELAELGEPDVEPELLAEVVEPLPELAATVVELVPLELVDAVELGPVLVVPVVELELVPPPLHANIPSSGTQRPIRSRAANCMFTSRLEIEHGGSTGIHTWNYVWSWAVVVAHHASV